VLQPEIVLQPETVLRPETLRLELPADYRWVPGARGLMAVWGAVAEEMEDAGFGPDTAPALAESEAVGRVPLGELATARGSYLVRTFHHGGLLRWLSGARFSEPRRPFEELLLSHGLIERGVRTPRIVAARARRVGLWWELCVVTERVGDATDIGRWIAETRRGLRSRAGLRVVARAFGELVRQLHDIGFEHADLQPNNVLVEEPLPEDGEPRLWVLDLDRSRWVGGGEGIAREKNLGRLVRFVERRERERGRCLGWGDRMRFLRGYEAEREVRHRLWRELGGSGGGGLRHHLGWRMESLFGGEDPREGEASR
jgi:3-deoxy-D-manno-octulosonic acid kinase